MQFIEKKEGHYRYYDEGSGPVVVILHGLFGSLSNFEELIALGRGNYRFIMPIFPIYDCDIRQANVSGMLEHLNQFINHLKLENFSLMGNSLGGHIALMYELMHPEYVKSLILTGSSGLFENTIGNEYPKRDKEAVRERISEIFGNKSIVTDAIVDEAHEIISSYSKIVRILRMAKSAVRQNLQHEIERIKTRTLLIWGAEDTITPPFVAEQFHEKIANSELSYIPACGHAPMMEYPKEFSEILFPFLDKVYHKHE